MREDRVLLVLADLRDHLDVEESAAPRGPRIGHPLMLVAAAVVVLLAASLVVRPVRDAVAEWLGVGSTRVHIDPERRPTGPALDESLGTEPGQSPDDTIVPTWVAGGPLGAPERAVEPPEGGVVLLWDDGTTALWIRPATSDSTVMFDKIVGIGSSVRRLDDLGDDAIVIDDDHILETPERVTTAGTTVVWIVDEFEMRLESDRPSEQLIEIARALEASRSAR